MAEPQFAKIPLLKVRVPQNPSRVGMDPDRLRALADDIAVNGLLQPIGVAGPDADGCYELGFGHRRTCACLLLERDDIEAKVWPAGTPLLTIRASENHMREQLTPIEEALELHRFTTEGSTVADCARKYRRSESWVVARLELLDLPDELQDAIHAGELSVSVAKVLREIDHEPLRKQYVRDAIQSGASEKVVRVWAAHYQADRERIIVNHETVEQIVASRSSYVVKFVCEGCQQEAPIEQTSAFRVCAGCRAAILQAMSGG